MIITQLKPLAQQLLKLGARRPKRSLQDLFGPPGLPLAKKRQTLKPDVDYHPDAEREPQAPNFSHMWLDKFRNIGNIKNPLASPMESGA